MTDPRDTDTSTFATGDTPLEGLLGYLDAELARVAPVAIWLSDPRGGLIHGNPECTRLYREVHGRDPQPGESLEELVPESRRAAWSALFARAAAGEAVESDLDVLMSDGGLRIYRVHMRPLRGRDGAVIRIICSAKDLTGRKRVEQRLLLFRAALETVDEGIVITEGGAQTASGLLIVYVNQSLLRMTGHAPKELLGRCPFETLGRTLSDSATKTIRTAIDTESPCTIESTHTRKDGSTANVELSFTPIRGELGGARYYLAIRRDVTQRKLLDAARQAETRAAVISRMASALAHRYNNLFTLMAGTGELLGRSTSLSASDRALLRTITQSVDEAAETTRVLLWLSQSGVPTLETAEPSPLLLEFGRRWGASPRNLQRLHLEIDPKLPQVRIDAKEFAPILEVLGAFFSHRPGRGDTLTVRASGTDEGTRILFTDDGKSLSDEDQGRLFEPFSGHGDDGFADLQLSAAQEAVRKMGGAIDVLDGAGPPRIGVTLPRAFGGHGSNIADRATPGVASEPPLVLVVEDEAKIRSLLCTVLAGDKYRVLDAASGEAALELLSSLPSPPALLLTDVVMPGISGRELADQLKSRWPELRVIFMSGYTGDTLVQQRVNESGMGFLAKPFTPRQLLGKIEEILAMPPARVTG